jgi:plasmid replication initiation protein
MKEIVKYHNDFNKIRLPSFTELEQNLLFGIISRVKENKEEYIFIETQEIKKWIGKDRKDLTDYGLYRILKELRNKFFKADFTIIRKTPIPEKNLVREEEITTNLFKTFWVCAIRILDDNDYVTEENFSELEGLTLQINPEFAYLVNELTKNFERFELAEFIALSGKYTKTLYRLLKQYRQTGKRIFEWQEFAELMDIPADYRQIDIDTRILKPAIKELTKKRNLFDITRIPFENLTCTKLNKNKKKCNKGDRVRHILFEWKPEVIEIDCKDFYSDFAEKHSGKTFYFNGYGKFVFKGLGRNLKGDRIFIFENEERARYSEKIDDYPTKNSLEKLAKNIINA